MSELRDILSGTVERLFADRVTRALRERAEEGAWPQALWSAVEENGLTRALVPERQGGAGASWREAYVIVHAAGRWGVPLPLPETVLAGWLLARSGLEVPAGPLGLAAAGGDGGLRLQQAGNRWRLTGTAGGIPWGGAVEHLTVVAGDGERAQVALVARDAYRSEARYNAAREPRDLLAFEASEVIASAPLGGGLGADGVRVHGALLRAAQMAGGVAFVLDQAVQYAGDRVQFGRPLAKFQAIQQQLATLAAHAAQAALAAETACRAADAGDPAFEVASAKIVAGEAARIAARVGHQVHGAIGFTYEHDLHFITRRLWSWRAEFGAEAYWAARLGRGVARRGADALWEDVTGAAWAILDST